MTFTLYVWKYSIMTHKSCPNGFEAEMELWLLNRGQITSFYDFDFYFFKLTKTMGSFMSKDENISSLFIVLEVCSLCL